MKTYLKMAMMIITYRVMPEDGEIEYSQLESVTKEVVGAYDASVKINSVVEHEVGFGLKAVRINLSVDENCGSEALEDKLKEQEVVGDVIVEAMSRAMG